MRFEFSHDFDAGADEVADAILNEAYQESLSDIGGLDERAVIAQRELEGGRVEREVRCVLGVELPGGARRILGDRKPAWVERATWEPRAKTWSWKIEPEAHGHLLSAHGTIELDGDSTSTTRRVHGEVRVHVPLYGGKVERVIVDHLERAYTEEAARLEAWLSP